MHRVVTSLILFFSLVLLSSAARASSGDGFIQGYGTAVLVREFGAAPLSIHVTDGVITLNADAVDPGDLTEAVSILMSIDGVARVEIVGADAYETESAGPAGAPESDLSAAEEAPVSAPDKKDAAQKPDKLFEPLMADPRWPRFAVSYHFFTDNGELDSLIASAIGGTIPVYEDTHPVVGRWQAAIQAAAFAINDLDTTSWDLLNSDYRFGLAFLQEKEHVSSIYRIYHFSTHAGDEFILNSGVDREDISYETVDAIFSHNLRQWLRVYGGGAYRFSRNPKDLDPWSFQYGAEIRGSRRYLKLLRPVAGANFYNKEENDWHTELSLRLGAEIEGPETLGHKVQFLLGYYNGPSFYGQFFYQSHEFLDFGIHLYF